MASVAVSHSLFSHKLFYSSSPIPLQNYRFNHFTVFACSLNKPSTRIRRKKVKSNDELCNDIRDFLSSVGLSQYHVPSTKQLSHHGRQDLANIVRRRGYKFIKQLLETSTTANIETLQSNELERTKESEGQEEKSESLADDIVCNEVIRVGEIEELQKDLKPIVVTNALTMDSTVLTMEEKVARFIQQGELDTVEDGDFGAIYDGYADKTEKHVESDDAHEPALPFNYQTANDISLHSSNVTKSLNGKFISSSALKVEDPVLSSISIDECTSLNPDKDLYAEVCNKQNMENQDEIKRLKSILHQKEVELTQLKELIEKEKLALSILQATAETEMSKAHNLVSEKENELYAAEESLSGLIEVEIQYSGEGETVELAGSFNGWHQNIPMDQHSLTTEPTGSSRSSRLWKVVLWLYPGVYEIKFVVDGHWRIDPERELTSRGSFNNNILRVDRLTDEVVY